MALLSIIVPVYNSEKTVARTLESLGFIKEQSRNSVEVLVVDDGSTDGSMKIVESMKSTLAPMAFTVLTQSNMGVSAARNAALEKAKGDWVLFLDADDELCIDPLPYIDEAGDATALAFSVRFFKGTDEKGLRRPVQVTSSNHMDVFTAGNLFTTPGIIVKRDAIKVLFNKEFYFLEDWLFWLENPAVFERVKIFYDVIGANIYSHGGNRTSGYAETGRYMVNVARKVMVDNWEVLTRKQKNNLFVQSQIGLLQQGKKVSLLVFFRWPLTMALYMKLVVYFFMKKHFEKFDLYGG